MEKFDVVVIGSGPGGYPAAIRAAQLGASVALVEKDQLGGVCLNWGCIPTKALISCSNLYVRIKSSSDMGLKALRLEFDYESICRRKDDVVGGLRQGLALLLKGNGIKVIQGEASFIGRNRIVVGSKGARDMVLDARSSIIATGAESVMPGVFPKSARIVDSTGFLALRELPKSLIVIGGGVIGCEFACMAAQLGSRVTIVEMLDEIVAPLDQDVRSELRRHMENELGIHILTKARMTGVKAGGSGVVGTAGDRAVEAQMMLVAVGRRACAKGLQLSKAGVKLGETGCVEVDEYCRTSSATIYAVGDVTGRYQLAHAATAQGITAAENACAGRRRTVDSVVPLCIFTSPEVGCVGLTEQEAQKSGLEVKVGKFAFAGLGRALAAGEKSGFVKVLADARTGQLVGAHAVGAHATELIAEAALAVRGEWTIEELGRTVHCHPTFAEAWAEAAHAASGECIHAPPRRSRRARD